MQMRMSVGALRRQLAMLFEQPHQDGIGAGEIRVLALELVRPLLAVEQIVAKAPDNHQDGQQPIAWVLLVPSRTDRTRSG